MTAFKMVPHVAREPRDALVASCHDAQNVPPAQPTGRSGQPGALTVNNVRWKCGHHRATSRGTIFRRAWRDERVDVVFADADRITLETTTVARQPPLVPAFPWSGARNAATRIAVLRARAAQQLAA